MKRILSITAALAMAFSASAFAASHKMAPKMDDAASAPAMSKQQSKMGDCNKEAAGKKGDERKMFMKECLSAAKPMTQQNKMKKCNVDAAGKKGDERKTFMKECLSA